MAVQAKYNYIPMRNLSLKVQSWAGYLDPDYLWCSRHFESFRELRRHLREEEGHFVTKKQLVAQERFVVSQFK